MPFAPSFEDPRRALARHGLTAKKSFSQNFLVSSGIVEGIAEACRVTPGCEVVELGPGLGTLTGALLRRGARVHAVERDREMIAVLEADLRPDAEWHAAARFDVEYGDAATFDVRAHATAAGAARLVVVGNLPYAITGAILRNLGTHASVLEHAVVMVQKEVRDRLVAQPATKEWGTLTVFTRARFRVETVLRAPAGAFHPPPKVDSAVVRLVPRTDPIEETDSFRLAVRAAFEQRRKTLRNGLLAVGADADAVLTRACIDGRRRGETLSLDELAALARELEG